MANNGNKFTVGQAVHYSFNGDSYPNNVKRVTKTQVQTEDHLFTLRADGTYRSVGHGTWILNAGHRDERNPCF